MTDFEDEVSYSLRRCPCPKKEKSFLQEFKEVVIFFSKVMGTL